VFYDEFRGMAMPGGKENTVDGGGSCGDECTICAEAKIGGEVDLSAHGVDVVNNWWCRCWRRWCWYLRHVLQICEVNA